jgi:hypothetical protein
MRPGCYVCTALLLAGLFTWGVTYWLEPKLYLITGNPESISGFGAPSGPVPSSQEANLAKGYQALGGIENKTLVLLKDRYGSAVNISKIMPAIVEDPSGSRIGIGYEINTKDGWKLVVVLPDGWMREYALPTKG